MFKPGEDRDPGRSAGAEEALTLPLALALPEQHGEVPRTRLGALRHWLASADWSSIDWTPDLAEDIGSRRWLRGAATLAGLSIAAFAFWPSFELQAAPAFSADQPVRDEYRSQMIMPLGLGGESGRHMAASTRVTPVAGVAERPDLRLTAILASGDSFPRMLQRAGVSAPDAGRAASLVSEMVPLDEIAAGTRFDLVLGARPAPDQPRVLDSIDFRARFDLALSLDRTQGELAISSRAIPVETTPVRIRGLVGPSLYRSARAAGVPAGAVQQYLQALDSHIDLDGDVQPGDAFDIVMAYKRAESGEVQPGQVLYAGLERGKQAVAELMRWGSGGEFYAADGLTRTVTSTSSAGMLWPVSGRITSNYGARFHPVLGYTRMHAGVDFGAAWGSPITATADGVVSFAGRHGGHGNYVRLDHGGGLGTGYGHMSSIAVAPGARVRAGQVIGYVGSTGLSTGPHLHYEMYVGGRTVNPLGAQFAVTTTVRQVDPGQVARFKEKLASFKAIRPGAGFGVAALAQGAVTRLR